MNNHEILKEAIEKAYPNSSPCFYSDEGDEEDGWFFTKNGQRYGGFSDFDVIFSHDFAKAFWGIQEHEGFEFEQDSYCNICRDTIDENAHPEFCWQYHLQRMVLEEDPIKYLEQFL